MSELNRDFKGVWIPKEVWLDERLSALEKCILAEINSLDGEEGCYASNKYLADFCQCSERKVSDSISKLVKCGYIEITSFDGRSRVVKTANQHSKNCEADSHFLLHSNIESNIVDNIDSYNPLTPKCEAPVKKTQGNTDYENRFNLFWSAYPKHVAKTMAKKAFLKLKPSEELTEEIITAVRRLSETENWKKSDGQFIPYPATFLNQHRWEDESPNTAQTKKTYEGGWE